jgi:RNA polymerase sigma factor (sigma-70 family)
VDEARALEALVVQRVEPVVRRVVRSRLGNGAAWAGQDADDVRSGALVRVVARLQDALHGGDPVHDIEGYAAAVARRACDDHLREKYPHRWRLKNQLRYVLSRDPRFALWQAGDGWRAGLAAWRFEPTVPGARLPVLPPSSASPADFLHALFTQAGGPLDFEAIVSSAAASWPLHDRCWRDVERLPDRWRQDVSTVVGKRLELKNLWQQILALPLRQRTALLLNLRDGEDDDVITAFPASGVASLEQIAAAIGVLEADLAELWNRLPLEDQEIAARLGLTRQQVINLRKSARARLARSTGHRAPG